MSLLLYWERKKEWLICACVTLSHVIIAEQTRSMFASFRRATEKKKTDDVWIDIGERGEEITIFEESGGGAKAADETASEAANNSSGGDDDTDGLFADAILETPVGVDAQKTSIGQTLAVGDMARWFASRSLELPWWAYVMMGRYVFFNALAPTVVQQVAGAAGAVGVIYYIWLGYRAFRL